MPNILLCNCGFEMISSAHQGPEEFNPTICRNKEKTDLGRWQVGRQVGFWAPRTAEPVFCVAMYHDIADCDERPSWCLAIKLATMYPPYKVKLFLLFIITHCHVQRTTLVHQGQKVFTLFPGRELALIYDLFSKVWKPFVTKPKVQSLFFQLFLEYLFT